jgi:tRNA/tmRNA/rRNA uracil-C5-methylase (TrmA/RlmC/RlmD family)
VLRASSARVGAPCPYAHANGCGGCDLQHASAQAQLDWKAAVVREQLARLAGLNRDVTVEPLPGNGFGWRTRVRYRVDAAGRPGLLKHRSNEVVPVDKCLIAHPSIQHLPVLRRTWPDRNVIEVVTPASGEAQIVEKQRIVEHAAGHDFEIDAGAFWQVHPAAADTLANTVIGMLKPQRGERAWDLYGGAGLFSVALADRGCEVTMVDISPTAPVSGIKIIFSAVEKAKLPKRTDLIVLDPPRTGAGAHVVRMVSAAAPRAIAYVACDPAALARDLKTFAGDGWHLRELRAFDLFPQTHHVECVALLTQDPM